MTYAGRVKNGVIVLDDPSAAPPEGTPVRVELVAEEPAPTLSQRFRGLLGKADHGVTEDLTGDRQFEPAGFVALLADN